MAAVQGKGHHSQEGKLLFSLSMSTSAKRRGMTPQLFAAWGRTQERTVTACPTRPRVVFDSVVHQHQRFKFDTAIVRQSVLLSRGQQLVDKKCQPMRVETVFTSPLLSSRGDHMLLTGQLNPRSN